MARRGYIRGRSQRYRDPFVSSTREPRPSLSLFRSTRNIYIRSSDTSIKFSRPPTRLCLRQPLEITFPRLTSSDTSRTDRRGDRGFQIKLKYPPRNGFVSAIRVRLLFDHRLLLPLSNGDYISNDCCKPGEERKEYPEED